MNLDFKGFHRKAIKYDWKQKVGSYLPDRRSTVVSSVLFMPLSRERGPEASTVRAMAWFSAAIYSGIPLVFINIQTEQSIITSVFLSLSLQTFSLSLSFLLSSSASSILKEKSKALAISKQQNTTTLNVVQGIRLWFLPGLAEVPVELFPQPGDFRFGMDIKRTEEVIQPYL